MILLFIFLIYDTFKSDIHFYFIIILIISNYLKWNFK